MKNKHNKPQLYEILSTYNFGKGVTMESRSDGVFAHDEADITEDIVSVDGCVTNY